jgi:undecaprenyl-diphosphatase
MQVLKSQIVPKLHQWWTRRSAPELLLYCGLLVVLLGGWCFVALADEILEGDTQHFDDWILQSLRRPESLHEPVGPSWLRYFFANVTSLGSGAIAALFALLVIGGLALQRRYVAIILITISLVGAGLLTSGLKATFGRQRPPIEYRAIEADALSFPSGHSVISAVLYLTLGAMLARVTAERRMKFYIIAVAVLLTFLVGFSRVYLGVHYTTDVLGGWVAGLIWAALCLTVTEILKARYKMRFTKPQGVAPPDQNQLKR